MKDVIVIGAGLTGLTTSYYLKKAGKNFSVIEKSGRIGGVIHTEQNNGFLYETGPNTGVLGNSVVADVFEEISSHCEIEKASDQVKKRYILKKGEWQAMPMGVLSGIKTPLFSLKDKLRILGEPFRRPGKNPHETLAEMVKRRMGRTFLDYAIDPFILGVYAGDPEKLVPSYALPKLYNLEQDYGSFIGGAIKKKIKEKHTKDDRVDRSVFSAKNGLSSLTNALYELSGKDNFVLNTSGIKVNPTYEGYEIEWLNEKNELQQEIAKNIITTTGSYELEKILPFVDESKMKVLNNLFYTNVVEVILGYNNWNGRELDGFGGLIPSKEKRDILGVLFMSSLFENRAPENGALFSVFMGGVRRPEIYEKNEDEIVKLLSNEIMDLMEIKEFNPDLLKVIWHKYAIPQYEVSSGERFEIVEEIEKEHPGLILGGNLKEGIGMADRMQQGKRLAEFISSRG